MDEILKEITNLAKQVFLKDGYCSPILFIGGTKKKVAISFKNFGDTNSKRVLTMLNAGTDLACNNNVGELDKLILVTEAWMGKNMEVLPSLDPKRIEVLIINSLDARTQDEHMKFFEIIRDPKGKAINLKEDALSEPDSAKGTLLSAFQKGYQLISPVRN